jgi:gluconolactonase
MTSDFNTLVPPSAQLEKLCSGGAWFEGPVWMHEDDSVLWSDIPNNRMLRWSAADGMSVWREKAEFTNGHTRDLNGDLLHCSHGLRAVVRTRASVGGISASSPDDIVIDRYRGARLNSPNDIVVRSDGTIWFTDPPYGILSNHEGYAAKSEQAHCYVFCLDPRTGMLHAATDFMTHPNGLAFSPDEKTLYVSDTSAVIMGDAGFHRIVAFAVDGFQLKRPQVFATIAPGLPDGFRVDTYGNVYTSSEDSVQVYAPTGVLLGKIPVPEKVGNLTFGGVQRNVLYICASTSLYRIVTATRGLG